MRPYEATASFDPRPGGPRFLLTYRPLRGPACGTVILAPPFAEELNKCRRMLAQTARALSADGWRVVQPDLYGCGDSAGEFQEATWEQWIADLAQVVDAWASHDGELWLWGVRAGALLLPPLLRTHPRANILLWQPANDGATVLNQFLRLSTSAALLQGEPAGDRSSLRQQLAAGASVEIAGYGLSPQLAKALAKARLELPAHFEGRIAWLAVVAHQDDATPAATRKTLDAWNAAGRTVEFETVVGPPFWQTVEIEELAELIERTCHVMRRRGALRAVAPQGMRT
ncbi:MAG: hydrolase 2, exosortase A system-associated [Sutterellaceae bacterium]|nr:hydrolase 2, exosortase A system-associated [Burkholderiaceae bacterium]MDW8429683.1 hydrolase 2, exosortase A system-associated [Sutterellaceae bacterium]